MDNVTEVLDSFNGFEKALVSYEELLNTEDKTLVEVERVRAELNRQLGVMNPALRELGVPRVMSMSGHELGIFEEALGPYNEDTAFVVHKALSKAIDITRQAIGTLQLMEAKHIRDSRAKFQEKLEEKRARMMIPPTENREEMAALNRPPRRWPLLVVGLALGYGARHYQDPAFVFLRSTEYPTWQRVAAAGTFAVAFLAGGVAVNRLSSSEKRSTKTTVILVVVALVAGVVTFFLTVPPAALEKLPTGAPSGAVK